jgi:hypothetical protein
MYWTVREILEGYLDREQRLHGHGCQDVRLVHPDTGCWCAMVDLLWRDERDAEYCDGQCEVRYRWLCEQCVEGWRCHETTRDDLGCWRPEYSVTTGWSSQPRRVRVRDIVCQWLYRYGYSGLLHEDSGCECDLGSLMSACEPGRLAECVPVAADDGDDEEAP